MMHNVSDRITWQDFKERHENLHVKGCDKCGRQGTLYRRYDDFAVRPIYIRCRHCCKKAGLSVNKRREFVFMTMVYPRTFTLAQLWHMWTGSDWLDSNSLPD